MTPQQHRDHATDLMRDAARHGERLSILAHLELSGEPWTVEDAKAIQELINTADVTVKWPEVQS
ncbi:hypothetical protein [Micromonospora sp. NBRC 107095]|uniref:hypothetical protein n=1 Tax=Micromonospora sp. NBRC 107095 TaxID=3032209 RepID=UPI0024A408C0|nr:hypothetical protein [Micromonospora sp. NBRC 107095]GLZ62853.1 hypothetical protein Misp05_64290 [Micromonospora sp. NBRC 107095]